MNIKKVLSRIFLGMCCVTGVTVSSVVLSACKTEVNETQEFTVTFNTLGGSSVDSKKIKDGEKVTKPDNPTREGYTFKYWSLSQDGAEYDFNTPITADTTLYAVWEKEVEVPPVVEDEKYTVTFNTVGGNVIDSIEVEKNGKVTKPADPTKEGYIFKHWSLTENGEAYDFNTQVTSNITLYAVWEEETEVPPVVETETLTRTLDVTITDLATDTSGKTINDEVVGYFTLGKGMKLEGDCINTQGKSITFTTTSAGVLTIVAEGASSNSNSAVSIVDGEGNSTHLDTLENKVRKTITWNIPAAGTYIVEQSKSIRVFSMSYTETVEKSEPSSIEINNLPNVNFLEGREFDYNGLNVSLIYENGREDVLSASSYTVSGPSADDMKTPGVYTVTISAKVEGLENPLTTSYDIVVYDLDSISLSLLDYQNKTNVYTQTIFLVGDEFNHNNLVVIGHGKYEDKTYDFVLDATEYDVSSPDLTSKGNKEVKVTSVIDNTKTKGYVVDVVENVIDSEAEQIDITITAGASTSVSSEELVFGSINEALAYLALVNIDDDVIKVLNVGEGTFEEKIEITLPNVHLIGSNPDINTSKTIIVYGAYNGLIVPSGAGTYSTDGSATLTISASAVGFEAKNITIENEINTLEEYKAVASDDKQAVAVMVEADQSIFDTVRFSGYQDTLYARNGRQYYINCYIEGRTDYIFGEDATAIFENSEIKSIGAGNDDTNGGYIIATKGVENLKYGYIFNNCKFTASEDVVAGTVSIARGWDNYMTTLIMNSEIGNHISKEAYGEVTATGKNKNDRYGNMNADPDASRLLEYNNTGEGSITESLVNTCTVLTEEQIAKYLKDGSLDYVKIYGKDTNGLNYTNDWTANKVAYDAKIEYYYNDELLYTQQDYVGTTIDSLYTPESISDMAFVGWYTTSTLDEGTEFDSTKPLEAETKLYAKYEVGSITENLRFDSYAQETSYSAGKEIYAGTYYSFGVDNTSDGGVETWQTQFASPATSNTQPAIAFTSAVMATSSKRVFYLTSTTNNLEVTIYYTMSDSKFEAGTVNQKAGELTINGQTVPGYDSRGNMDSNIGYAVKTTVSAGQTILIGENSGSNRLIIYGIDVAVK